MIRTFLAWLYRALGRAGSTVVPEMRLPEWRQRQMLRPEPGKVLYAHPGANREERRRIIARGHLCNCEQRDGKHFEGDKDRAACSRPVPFWPPASPAQRKIALGIRNAVAVGFRKYHRLSAKTPDIVDGPGDVLMRYKPAARRAAA